MFWIFLLCVLAFYTVVYVCVFVVVTLAVRKDSVVVQETQEEEQQIPSWDRTEDGDDDWDNVTMKF
jgi:hypothetical protein